MPHEERRALIRRPFPITYIPSVKRWGGVQIIHDEQWMEDANAWKKRYAQDHSGVDASFDDGYREHGNYAVFA